MAATPELEEWSIEQQVEMGRYTEENVNDKRAEYKAFMEMVNEFDKETFDKTVPMITQTEDHAVA